MNTTMKTADGTTTIEADPNLPLVRMSRDFQATPAQLVRAHTDAELFVKWVGPDGMDTHLDHWDARTGGSWRYTSVRGDEVYAGLPNIPAHARPIRIAADADRTHWRPIHASRCY